MQGRAPCLSRDRRHACLQVRRENGGSTKDKPAKEAPADETKEPEAAGSSSGGEGPEPEPVSIDVDDANRFVKEDLDRFLRQYPQALRKQDAELFQTCLRAQCLEHGVSKTVTPFSGPGVRYLVPLWLRGCLSGSAEACMYAGRTYQSSELASSSREPVHEGWEKKALDQRFRMYIDRACKLDETECEQWADFLLGDDAPAADDVKLAIQRLEEGCARKEYGSCAALARHAPEHPAIGDEIDWWRQACEHDPNEPSRECARYASRLLATGGAADRTKAVEALGPTCDPSSKAWAEACEGDPETGDEACDSIYVHSHGNACIALARTLPDEEALRLEAAMCVGSIVDDTNALMQQACTRAADRATKLGRSPEYRANLARRTCEVAYHLCLSETYDLDKCGKARDSCKAKAGG